MLFRELGRSVHKASVPKVAVLNVDDPSYAYLHAIPAEIQVTYGLANPADVGAGEVRFGPDGVSYLATWPKGNLPITSPLVGEYNVYNILAAISMAHGWGVSGEAVQRGIAAVQGVTGRMERIDQGQPFLAIVDFAHTPNALDKALRAARQLVEGRVIVVFGCAGLRDRAKRPWMGRIAGELADATVITAEDPRTESLDGIMAQSAQGSREAGAVEGRTFWRVADRAEAIVHALGMAEAGDLVIITGKGHERSMCYGTVEHPWSDHQAVRDALATLGYA